MQFILNEHHRNTPDDELLEDIKKVATVLNQDTVTIADYNQYGKFHATTLVRRFGSWFICLDKAGLNPSRSKINITNEELFEELERVWIKLGKQPSYSEMRDYSKFSIGTYEKRFGGWRNTLKAFVSYVNESASNYERLPIRDEGRIIHHTSRNITLRTRFLVMQRDNFKCCMCGRSPATTAGLELHIDHIVPWSKGGETVIDNLQTLCSDCNLNKSDLIQ